MRLLNVAAVVLRDPKSLISDSQEGDVARLAPPLLTLAIVGLAVLGAVVGTYRGGAQIPAAAVKMPFLFFVPLLVSLPAARALFGAAGAAAPWSRLALASLVGAARSGVLSAAAAPVLWCLLALEPSYHIAVLCFTGVVGALGLPCLLTVRFALPVRLGVGRSLAAMTAIGIVGLSLMQTGWLLRPFIARPTAELTFLRPVEEDVFSSLEATGRASVGLFSWEARRSSAWDAWGEP